MSNREITLWCVLAGFALICLVLGGCSVTCVPAGHVGVTTSFGQVDGAVDEGLNFVKPWKQVKMMSVRTQEIKESAYVPTREGLNVWIEVTLLYRLSKDKAAEVFQKVGPDYGKVVVENQFRSAMRDATVNFDAKDLYTANREQVEKKLNDLVAAMLTDRGVIVEAVRLRDIQLPSSVSERIAAKLAADQDAQRMAFVLKKEEQEAERKRVEAKGIADAQEIIQKKLSDQYIRYSWVQALKEHHGAIIYVPTGSDGHPFFKDVDKVKP